MVLPGVELKIIMSLHEEFIALENLDGLKTSRGARDGLPYLSIRSLGSMTRTSIASP